MNIGQFLDTWGIDVNLGGVRKPCIADMVIFVDESPDSHCTHLHKPALVQHTFENIKGLVHLHVFEDKPQDNRAVDAFYSNGKEPGSWHFVGD